MRIARLLITDNWKHAVGELILVVTGILIALAANSWYEDRKVRREEIQILGQFRLSLDEDHQLLMQQIADYRRFEQNANRLFVALSSKSTLNQELTDLFSSINAIRQMELQFAPFEALRSRGFDLISKDQLRMGLISLYDGRYERAQRSVRSDGDFVRERIRPYLLENFRRNSSDEWTPKDLDEIQESSYLANASKLRAYTLRNFAISALVAAVDENRQMAQLIDQEIGQQE